VRRRAAVAGLLLLGASGALAGLRGRLAGDAPAEDVPLPLRDLHLATLDGAAAALPQGRVLIVNFWATWCGPCRRELPSLQRLADALDGRPVAVVGVSVDRDPDFVREYLGEAKIRFANYIDPDRRVVRDVLRIASFPETWLVDREGRVRDRVLGSRAWDDGAAREAVLALLAEQQRK
jgi:thiol-disulfide isomerase/thioredoxin